MKQSFAVAAFLAAAGVASAQTTTTAPEDKMASPKFRVEVVSVDTVAKTLTVKKAMTPGAEEPKPRTGGTDMPPAPVVLKVDDMAAATLSSYKTGDVVTLTCRNAIGPEGAANPSEPGSASGTGTTGMTGVRTNRCDLVTAISKS